MAEVESIRKQVEELSKKNPSPHNDNRKPIETNIALYKKTADQLAVFFAPRMKELAEKFVLGLVETNPRKEDGKVIPLTVEQFRKDYEEMWNKGQSYVDKQYNYNIFREERFKNWNAQIRKFLPLAQKLTQEPLNADNLPEMLFSYIGIPRIMGEQPEQMVKYMKNYQNALVNLMTTVKFNTMGVRVDWFGFTPDPDVVKIAALFNSPRDHYPQIARVWDIFGDVLKRMTSCTKMISYTAKNGQKVSAPYSRELVNRLNDSRMPFTTFDDNIDTFQGLVLRAAMSKPTGGENSGNDQLRNAIAGNDEGIFKVYRMRITVGASVNGVRTFVKALENAYRDHHVYVIRSIALYAERDGAASIFQNREDEANPSDIGSQHQHQPQPQPQPTFGRGRGRGRIAQAPPAPQPKIDSAELERQRKLEEEAYKKLKFYERPGYGDVLIGDDRTCKAVIDFDCFQLK